MNDKKKDKSKGELAIERAKAAQGAGMGHNKSLFNPEYQKCIVKGLEIMAKRDELNEALKDVVSQGKDLGFAAHGTRANWKYLRMDSSAAKKIRRELFDSFVASGQQLMPFELSGTDALAKEREEEKQQLEQEQKLLDEQNGGKPAKKNVGDPIAAKKAKAEKKDAA